LTGNPAPRRGEIWLADVDKPRPVVVTTIRDIPTAVRLGHADGVDRDCVAALDGMTLLRRERFARRLGELSAARMSELCAALSIAVSCDAV
jgi:mRNA interferase MazF